MILRLVQAYGQIRLGKLLAAPLGLLVTLSVVQHTDNTPAILISPYRAGDEDNPENFIVKPSGGRITIPVKFRRAAGITRYVELLPQGGGQVLVKPHTDT